MIIVKLTQNQVTCIDNVDCDIANFKWCATKAKTGSYYAQRSLNPGTEYLHRVILSRILGRELLRTEDVDHINLDKLDNTRKNLRLATRQQNTRNRAKSRSNTSGYKGVIWDKSRNLWRAQIMVNRKSVTLGYRKNIQDAIELRHNAELQFFGSFAYLD